MYADLLKEYIQESGMSLSEISEQLKKHGHRIDKSYISKLQNGKVGPGSTRLNQALADVTGGDPTALIEAAFYDIAPASVKRVIDEQKRLIDSFDPDEYQAYLSARDRMHKEMVEEIRERFNREYDEDFIQANSNIQVEYESRLKEINKKHEERLREIREEYKDAVPNILDVPLFESIPANIQVTEAQVKGWAVLVNPMKLKDGDLFMLTVPDDGMIGSRIYEGDLVVVQVMSEIENGEIAIVNVNGEDATLKRIKKINGQLILTSDNPKYEPIIVEPDAVRVCGKVVHVMFDPNDKQREGKE